MVARALQVDSGDIGMAGLKDRRAVTRQWISVPRRCEPLLPRLDDPRVRVLDVRAHRNKLRTGHLRGNRFVITLRDVVPDAHLEVAAKIARLAQRGVPNFYGSQRMGHGGSTLAAGWALGRGLQGWVRVRLADDTVHTVNLHDRALRRLAASALQAEVFNRALALRMSRGWLDTVLAGDVCRKVETGGQFVSDDRDREQQRLLAGQIELTGPMWGPKMPRPQADAALFESEALAACGADEALFAGIGALAEGTRRALVVRPQQVSFESLDHGLVLRFELPAGSFATGFVHELVGPIAGGHADADSDGPGLADMTADAPVVLDDTAAAAVGGAALETQPCA
jgi:tRNA pseudouridine13 synthase